MKILLTGGSGLLGTELRKHIKLDAPSHQELDITKQVKGNQSYDLIIHAAAYTDVVGAETKKKECYKVNVTGTLNLLNAFVNLPFVYISSEYAKAPVNYYAKTKLLAENEVKKRKAPYLIIRTLFKPNPFPYPKAFIDQYTQGDYVDVITPLLLEAVMKWDKKTSQTIYVGTGRKTIFQLAKKTRDVKPMSVNEVTSVTLPKDY